LSPQSRHIKSEDLWFDHYLMSGGKIYTPIF